MFFCWVVGFLPNVACSIKVMNRLDWINNTQQQGQENLQILLNKAPFITYKNLPQNTIVWCSFPSFYCSALGHELWILTHTKEGILEQKTMLVVLFFFFCFSQLLHICGKTTGNGGAYVRRYAACFGMCQKSVFREVVNTGVKCAPTYEYSCGVFVRLSSVWQTSKSIRACWGRSSTTLCFKYESHLRYCPHPQGTGGGMNEINSCSVTHAHCIIHTDTRS